jgi:hypothetical protein
MMAILLAEGHIYTPPSHAPVIALFVTGPLESRMQNQKSLLKDLKEIAMPEKSYPQEQHETIVTQNAIVISLTEAHKQQMQRCIKRSGEVKITFREISVTKLPSTLHTSVVID